MKTDGIDDALASGFRSAPRDEADYGLGGFERFDLGWLIEEALTRDEPPPPDTLLNRYREQRLALATIRAWEKGLPESDGRPACMIRHVVPPGSASENGEPKAEEPPKAERPSGWKSDASFPPFCSPRLERWARYAGFLGRPAHAWRHAEVNLADQVLIPWAEQPPPTHHGEVWSVEKAYQAGRRASARVREWNEDLNRRWREKARRKWLLGEHRWPLDVAYIALSTDSLDEFLDVVDHFAYRDRARYCTALESPDDPPGPGLLRRLKAGELTLTCLWDSAPTRIAADDAWRLESFLIYQSGLGSELYAAQRDDQTGIPGSERELEGGIRLTHLRVDREQILALIPWGVAYAAEQLADRSDTGVDPLIGVTPNPAELTVQGPEFNRSPALRRMAAGFDSPTFRNRYPEEHAKLAKGERPTKHNDALLRIVSEITGRVESKSSFQRLLRALGDRRTPGR